MATLRDRKEKHRQEAHPEITWAIYKGHCRANDMKYNRIKNQGKGREQTEKALLFIKNSERKWHYFRRPYLAAAASEPRRLTEDETGKRTILLRAFYKCLECGISANNCTIKPRSARPYKLNHDEPGPVKGIPRALDNHDACRKIYEDGMHRGILHTMPKTEVRQIFDRTRAILEGLPNQYSPNKEANRRRLQNTAERRQCGAN